MRLRAKFNAMHVAGWPAGGWSRALAFAKSTCKTYAAVAPASLIALVPISAYADSVPSSAELAGAFFLWIIVPIALLAAVIVFVVHMVGRRKWGAAIGEQDKDGRES